MFSDESESGGLTTEQKYLCTISKIPVTSTRRTYIGVTTKKRTAGWLDAVTSKAEYESFDKFVTTDSDDGALVYYMSLTKSERESLLDSRNRYFDTIQPTINDLKISPMVDSVGDCGETNPYPIVRISVPSKVPVGEALGLVDTFLTDNPSLCAGNCGGGAGCTAEATGDVTVSKNYGNEIAVFGVDSPSAFAAALIGDAGLESYVISVTSDMPTKKNNDDAAWIVQSGNKTNAISHTPFWDRGITGAGVTVGVADSGLDHQSCYFFDSSNKVNFDSNVNVGSRSTPIHENIASRKVVQYVGYADPTEGENGGHGTHVAGSIVGNSPGAAHNGMSYDAKVAFFDIGQPNAQFLDVPGNVATNMFPYAKRVGANSHSNSWGSDSNSYTGTSQQMDAYTWENQDFLVLVAAGNSGGDGTNQFPGSLGSPATSKNCLAVGATENENVKGGSAFANNDLAYFSSRGPAYDGRIKPDLVAPGFYIDSANSVTNPTDGHCTTTSQAGTSMATPVTAGAAALVQQYFEDGFYPKGVKTAGDGFKPMGALVKAVLINGAQRILPSAGPNANFQGSGWPNMDQGHGVVELDATLNFNDVFTGQGLYARGDFNKMSETSFSTSSDPPVETKFKSTGVGCVSGEDKDFRATLSWFDRPATSSSSRSLVNDLDIVVTGSDNSIYYPNGGTGRDNLNNVESVVFTPTQGVEYTVKISVDSMDESDGQPQPYAYVVSGCFESPDRPNEVDGGGIFGSDLPWDVIGYAAGGIAALALLAGLAIVGMKAFAGRTPRRANAYKAGGGYKNNNHRRSSATARRSGGGSFTTGTGFLGQGRTGSSAKSGAHKPQITIGLGKTKRPSVTGGKTKYHGKVAKTFNSSKWDSMV
eukprot:CAMPEP_0118661860 /NCGR_PEP_ID=MMETSP0785-20121206/16513_1 /TAXON_ID=91992 /ORGANISM="Bolidomonas pacifica, Strain CCMP 1866" /LENGTH=871 /DNA_ID=CAMNT_0006555345 /DNA_START=294 /DNA_END=2909 /DNA_ORIENTATION=-